MRLMLNNLADDATLTATGAHANYPATNIQHPHLSRYCRSDGTSLVIVFDLGSAQDITTFILAGHNISDSATVTLEANSSDSWVGAPFSETITDNYKVICEYFTEITYRYVRLSISDASNPDGYVKLGRVYIGEYLQMPYMDKIFDLPRKTNTQIKVSSGRQSFSNIGEEWIEFQCTLVGISAKKRASMETELITAMQNGAPVLLAVWEESFDTQPCLYGVISKDSYDPKPAGDGTYNLVFEFGETK